MPNSTLDISPELLTVICQGLQNKNMNRRFKIIENELPADVRFVSATLIGTPDAPAIRLTLESNTFIDNEELPLPILQVSQ